MDGVSAQSVAQSVEALNEVMQQASAKSIDMAEKLVKVALEMSLGKEPGKGANIDTYA